MPSRCLKHSAGDPGRKACSPVTFRRKTAARPESRRGVREASRDFTRGAPVSGGGSRRRRMLGARHPLPIWPPVHARPGPLGSGGVASSLPTSELNSFSLFRQRCSAQGLYHENRSTDANLHGLGDHPPDRSFWARLVEIANSQPVGAEASLVFCFHWSAFMSIKHTFFFFFFFDPAVCWIGQMLSRFLWALYSHHAGLRPARRGPAGDPLLEFRARVHSVDRGKGKSTAQAACSERGNSYWGSQVGEKLYNFGWPGHLRNLNLKFLKVTKKFLSSVRTKLSVLPPYNFPK